MKLCQIYNGASAYRESIYRLLDETFDTDWVFGKSLGDIKLMDTNILRGHVEKVDNISIWGNKAYWQKGVLKYIFRPYTHYIILGDERCLSTWIFLFLSLFFPKKKIYFWSHGQYGKEGFLKTKIERFFWSFVDGAFLYGNYAKKIMTKNGFKTDTFSVVHNSLSYDKQLEIRKSRLQSEIFIEHFGSSNPVIIFIGRLTKVKRLDLLLNAIALLREKGRNFNLALIGSGEELINLRQMVERLHIENQVWFYGACYDEMTNAELVYNSDLCVAPGNVGLTAMHTMMFGCPVITHNDFPWQMPEFEAIKAGETGDFFERNNVESLAATISKWFAEKKDKREEVRQACYKEIDTNWNPYYQMEVIMNVFKDKVLNTNELMEGGG